MCSDSKIGESIKCGRTKCTSIVKNVLGYANSQQLWESLRSTNFSLIVDESTDKGRTKHLALVVRLLENNLVQDAF